jgi:uroporphyrinogen-III decarboxylase
MNRRELVKAAPPASRDAARALLREVYAGRREVIAEARRVRDLMSQGGGYIFSPSQEIQGDALPEKSAVLRQAAQEER